MLTSRSNHMYTSATLLGCYIPISHCHIALSPYLQPLSPYHITLSPYLLSLSPSFPHLPSHSGPTHPVSKHPHPTPACVFFVLSYCLPSLKYFLPNFLIPCSLSPVLLLCVLLLQLEREKIVYNFTSQYRRRSGGTRAEERISVTLPLINFFPQLSSY